ncbi:MAG: hypothetical protein QME78_04440 [Thermodesulfobacteriota bacterium]|nr:hypothetical protein [Thermodesulfobacteriota bacterium]
MKGDLTAFQMAKLLQNIALKEKVVAVVSGGPHMEQNAHVV